MGQQADRLLVVEDDASVRDAVADYLGAADYAVDTAADAAAARACCAERRYDLVVLDIMMPGEDGLSLCRYLSDAGTAVLIISALSSTQARIIGLETGATDYITKPFDPRELLARVRAMLRRRVPASPDGGSGIVHFAGLSYDHGDSTLRTADGVLVSLTAGDLRLLAAFLQRPGRLLTRDTLLDLTRSGREEPFERAIDLGVSRLRRKLQAAGAENAIETVRGLGYRFKIAVSGR